MAAAGQKRRAAIVAALVYAIPMTIALGVMSGRWDMALLLGLGSGLLFGVVMARFAGRMEGDGANQRLVTYRDFGPGETIVLEGAANHFKGLEGVGGKLFLTERRLRFISHSLNVQTHDESWPLDRITEAEATRTLKLIPNGLRVTLDDGSTERFVVWGHREWADALRGE